MSDYYTIKIRGMEIPLHQAWKKIEVLQTAADVLERMNAAHPDLATEFTRGVVPDVRKRLEMVLENLPPPPKKDGQLEIFARNKLMTHSPEEVIDLLRDEMDIEVDIVGLVYLASSDAYLNTLLREAREFEANQIAPDQTAKLWNEMERPAPGKPLWNKQDVENLLGGEDLSW